MLQRLFVEHPKSVGETYLEHQRQAFSFGTAMFFGGLACFVHGLVPGWCRSTGSQTIERLNERLQVRRPAATNIDPANAAKATVTSGSNQ